MVNNASLFSVPWHTLFSFGIWTIWIHCNKVVFQNQAPSPSIHQEVIQRAVEFFFCAQGNSLYKPRILKMVRWERPYRGWYKLNTDGSALGNPGIAGGCSVLRDDAGLWVNDFARQIGHTTSFLAELWALRDGLTMCLDLNINALEIDLDAKVVVDLMDNSGSSNASNSSIVADCRLLISRISQVKVRHCYRESNSCADALARLGAKMFLDFLFFSSLPPSLFNIYVSDLYGLYHSKLCPGPVVIPPLF